MKEKTLDFLVTAVDNFGDTGFALDLAESVLFERPDWNVRFFSDDRPLFDRLTASSPHLKISYFDLCEYENAEPAKSVVSFFDRKLPEEHFAKFPHSKKILQLSYLRFDSGVASMNGTRYRLGEDEVVHLVPSPLEWGAGIVVGRTVPSPGVRNFSEPHGASLFLQKISKPGTGTASGPRTGMPELEAENPASENSVSFVTSAFSYPPTRTKLHLIRQAEPKIRFAEFGNPDAEIPLPFVRFDEYASMLGNFRSNVVRGENSAIKAMLAGKPFLWDFYKESNGAHTGKITDFLEFMRPFFDDEKNFAAYADATRVFNSNEFHSESARKCADVLTADDPSVAEAFRKASEKIRERDLVKTVIGELES